MMAHHQTAPQASRAAGAASPDRDAIRKAGKHRRIGVAEVIVGRLREQRQSSGNHDKGNLKGMVRIDSSGFRRVQKDPAYS